MSTEAKDLMCLQALIGDLERRAQNITIISVFQADKEAIYRLVQAPCPVVVSASVFALDYIRMLRDDLPFVSIGTEHGLAPFKEYTWSRKFLDYDLYLAPSEIWAKRLRDMYKMSADNVRVGGYPRLDYLRSVCNDAAAGSDYALVPAWKEINKRDRCLVAFSWGVSLSQLQTLPDLPNIAYLLHPSEDFDARLLSFKQAKVIRSGSNIAEGLLAKAGTVFGDFSSMTFEACALGLPTSMFIDRLLYTSDCDMSPSFFVRGSADFARVPHTSFAIPEAFVLNVDQLHMALQGGTSPSRLNDELVAPLIPSQANVGQHVVDLIGSKIIALSTALASEKRDAIGAKPLERVDIIRFIFDAYDNIFARSPDFEGLTRYVGWLCDRPTLASAIEIYHEMLNSSEGEQKGISKRASLPIINLSR